MTHFRSPNLLLGPLCAITLFANTTVVANSDTYRGGISQEAHDLRGYACSGALGDDYDKFMRHLTREGLELPDWRTYIEIECPNSNYILQSTLIPNSIVFLQKFIIGIYHKYGEEEVSKIINQPARLFGYTLLEEAIIWDRCRENSTTDRATIISFLKKVGGKTRPNFMSYCREFIKK